MKNNTKEKFARLGIATKGLVYSLVGILTALAAFGAGGGKTGKSGILNWIASQPYGPVLLAITAIGLTGFVFWRLYQTFSNPEDKKIWSRIGYFISGVFYASLAFVAFKKVVESGSSSGSGNGKQQIIAQILEMPFGQILVIIVALAFLGKAIYQLYRALSGKFKDKVKEAGLDSKARKIVTNVGIAGYLSRGIVIGIISIMTFEAALSTNSQKTGSSEKAFSFLQNEFGSIILGVIALGLLAYGVFMFVKARYRQMSLD